MKLPLSVRLDACAAMVPQGSTVADVGCDHGYLGIRLLQSGAARFVYASDLREGPLNQARINAARFSVSGQMEFACADGLAALAPDMADCVVIAGMGGENIAGILRAAPWTRDPAVTLVLQPQSSANDLRAALGEMGYTIECETLVREASYLYSVMRVRWADAAPVPAAEQFCSKALLQSGCALLPEYLDRLIASMSAAAEGMARAGTSEKLEYYQTALLGLKEMRGSL